MRLLSWLIARLQRSDLTRLEALRVIERAEVVKPKPRAVVVQIARRGARRRRVA